jgi:hypothetical protein
MFSWDSMVEASLGSTGAAESNDQYSVTDKSL